MYQSIKYKNWIWEWKTLGKYGRVRELVTGTLLLDSDVPIPFFADTDFCIV